MRESLQLGDLRSRSLSPPILNSLDSDEVILQRYTSVNSRSKRNGKKKEQFLWLLHSHTTKHTITCLGLTIAEKI